MNRSHRFGALIAIALLASPLAFSAEYKDADGRIVNPSVIVAPTGVGNIVAPVSASNPLASGLPSGAATSARQDTGNTSLSSIDGKVATSAQQDSIIAKLPALGTGGTPSADVISVQGVVAGVPQKIVSAPTTSANILAGLTTTSGGTVITIPATRTWSGTVIISGSILVAGGGTAISGSVRASIAGTNAIPSAGDYLRCEIQVGNSVIAGMGLSSNCTASIPMVVTAPAGNAVTLVLNTTNTTQQSASAFGFLL